MAHLSVQRWVFRADDVEASVSAAAQQVDAKTMTIQVIEGLKALGASPSSTFVIPPKPVPGAWC